MEQIALQLLLLSSCKYVGTDEVRSKNSLGTSSVMEIIELVVLIILNVDEHLILDHIHRPNEV